ncbi:hypothetical protein CDL12_27094 [Handroanthus impetiginosus]|uniref:Uncharacterized protein n=1 Tax=Handroanthus impetiginosus TaxID=429701 RepID=A0A2G9G512_9LAMI|nr:hypothetical protein CDL12_27094 [Handroanthus impetiginosus]
MEAMKERKEQMEKEEKQNPQDGGKDPMAKAREIIGEAIISKSDCGEAENEKDSTANKPDDVLAYSRAVRHIDSSLE